MGQLNLLDAYNFFDQNFGQGGQVKRGSREQQMRDQHLQSMQTALSEDKINQIKAFIAQNPDHALALASDVRQQHEAANSAQYGADAARFSNANAVEANAQAKVGRGGMQPEAAMYLQKMLQGDQSVTSSKLANERTAKTDAAINKFADGQTIDSLPTISSVNQRDAQTVGVQLDNSGTLHDRWQNLAGPWTPQGNAVRATDANIRQGDTQIANQSLQFEQAQRQHGQGQAMDYYRANAFIDPQAKSSGDALAEQLSGLIGPRMQAPQDPAKAAAQRRIAADAARNAAVNNPPSGAGGSNPPVQPPVQPPVKQSGGGASWFGPTAPAQPQPEVQGPPAPNVMDRFRNWNGFSSMSAADLKNWGGIAGNAGPRPPEQPPQVEAGANPQYQLGNPTNALVSPNQLPATMRVGQQPPAWSPNPPPIPIPVPKSQPQPTPIPVPNSHAQPIPIPVPKSGKDAKRQASVEMPQSNGLFAGIPVEHKKAALQQLSETMKIGKAELERAKRIHAELMKA